MLTLKKKQDVKGPQSKIILNKDTGSINTQIHRTSILLNGFLKVLNGF